MCNYNLITWGWQLSLDKRPVRLSTPPLNMWLCVQCASWEREPQLTSRTPYSWYIILSWYMILSSPPLNMWLCATWERESQLTSRKSCTLYMILIQSHTMSWTIIQGAQLCFVIGAIYVSNLKYICFTILQEDNFRNLLE